MGQRRGLLLDIDGVLTVSWRALPGAVEALARLRAAEVPLAFVTNTTSATRAEVAARLVTAGFDVDAGEVTTAPRAAAGYLRAEHPGGRCLLLNSGSVGDDLEGVRLAGDGGPVDVVLTGGAGPEIGYDLLNRAFRALMDGAPLVAMHRNLDWETADGLQLDMGAFIAGLERAAGVEATVVGKPSPAFFASVLDRLGLGAGDVLMVGDDIDADVLGAQACGISGVLVRTGKFRPGTLARAGGTPDRVVGSIADVPALVADAD